MTRGVQVISAAPEQGAAAEAWGRALVQGGQSRRMSALAGNRNVPYDAADLYSDHMAEWAPFLWSPDGELNVYRDRIVARVRDLVRNDGWAAGAVTRILDNAIGANFRPLPKPDFAALRYFTGNKGFDEGWALAFGRAMLAGTRLWGHGRGRWNDAQRVLTLPQQMRLGFRHKLVDGDALGILHWIPERCAPGLARYATALQIVDPDRLSNPYLVFDQRRLRGGVVVDPDNHDVAVGYMIRKAHQGDWFNAVKSLDWEEVPRETSWGRPIVVHDFDSDRGGTHRGGAGVLTPVIQRLKMLIKYDGAELDAALINAIFGAFIESPFDSSMVADALSDQVGAYQDGRADFHRERGIRVRNAQVTQLYPGEKMNFAAAERPGSNFAEFEKAVLRNIASAAGLSAQQVSNDWSDVNYSSARGAMLEFWKTLTRRRDDFAAGFGQPVYHALVEEMMDVDDVPLPPGAPPFEEFADLYARAIWIGPGRGWIDPVNEIKGAVLGMDAALMDFDQICAEQGVDPDDMIAARAHTLQRFKDAGLEPPTWSGMNPMGEPAERQIRNPEPA